MGRNILLGAVLCAFLLAAAPAQATITAVLEEPGEGSVSGIAQIRGHARAADNAHVTVTLRVNGETRTEADAIIPCCSGRSDVSTEVNTGFSTQINYGVFPAGPLTIDVEITAEGCDPVTIDRSVQVVRLSDEEFVPTIDLSSAQVSIVDGEIVVTGVVIPEPAAASALSDNEAVNAAVIVACAGAAASKNARRNARVYSAANSHMPHPRF